MQKDPAGTYLKLIMLLQYSDFPPSCHREQKHRLRDSAVWEDITHTFTHGSGGWSGHVSHVVNHSVLLECHQRKGYIKHHQAGQDVLFDRKSQTGGKSLFCFLEDNYYHRISTARSPAASPKRECILKNVLMQGTKRFQALFLSADAQDILAHKAEGMFI